MNFYVGTSGYSYKEWKGKFYPKKLPNQNMLQFYAEHFRSVESNYTFRRIPDAALVKEWTKAVPAGFKFVLKAPQRLTHMKRLKDAGDLVSQLLDAAKALKKHQGPVLYQLPPNMKKDLSRLREFLKHLPLSRRSAFEFRHQSWFDDEVIDLLRKRRARAEASPEVESDLEVPFVATADWGYLRLRQFDYTDLELRKWVKRIRQQAWCDVFVFFKHDDKGKAPQLAKRFMELAER